MSILIENKDMPPEGEKYLLEIRHDGTVYDAIGQRVAAHAVQATSPWRRVEDGLPDDEVPVLAMLHNTYGRNVVLKLCHIGHHKRTTEEYGWQEYEGETEYDEENDCFWIPEGWWESNYHEDNLNWEIGETDGTITHWMPLPEPPKEGEHGN